MILEKKYVFHIPLCRCSDNGLVRLEIDDLIKDLLSRLSQSGYDALHVTKTKGYYISRCFDELLITLFSKSSQFPEDIFTEWFRQSNHILKQEALAYECRDKIFIEKLK